jgi:hypothetical protein
MAMTTPANGIIIVFNMTDLLLPGLRNVPPVAKRYARLRH